MIYIYWVRMYRIGVTLCYCPKEDREIGRVLSIHAGMHPVEVDVGWIRFLKLCINYIILYYIILYI